MISTIISFLYGTVGSITYFISYYFIAGVPIPDLSNSENLTALFSALADLTNCLNYIVSNLYLSTLSQADS